MEFRKLKKIWSQFICKNDLVAKNLGASDLGKALKGKFQKTAQYQSGDWQQCSTFPLSWFLKKNHQSTQPVKLNIVLAEENKSVIGSQDIPALHYAMDHLTRKF